MTRPVKWRLTVEQLMACNCNYGCPCAFNAPPTYGSCEGALAYHIVEGKIEGVGLHGLNWVLAASWPGPLHERNGRGILYLDERADLAQREALRAVASGRAGGPIAIFMSTITAGLDVRTAPIEMQFAGNHSWFRVPEAVNVAFGPIRNPVTGAEHLASAVLRTGMLTKREDFYSAETFSVNADGLQFSYPRRNAYAYRSTWRGP